MIVATPILHLVYRNPDGSPAAMTWYFYVIAVYVIVTSMWLLISPTSYWRLSMRGRGRARRGLFPLSAGASRVLGAAGILVAVVWVFWLTFLADPGRLH